MTWNLWWRFGDHERRAAAIAATISQVTPDVVCLQEVWSDANVDSGQRLADELGMHHVANEPDQYGFANAVISRWPLRRLADHRLPGRDGSPGHRRAVVAEVGTPWGPWPIVSTHFDHRFDDSATRQRQAADLLMLAAAHRGDPATALPVVVGADLNAVPDSDEVRLLTGRRDGVDGIVLSDCWDQVGDDPGHTWSRANPHTADSAWPGRRLDYVLVSWPRPKPIGNPISAHLAGDGPVDVGGQLVWPSDHAAVVVDLVTPT